MLIAAYRYLRAAWSPPPCASSRTHHYHHHHHQEHSADDNSIENLLEPIRYSMAFLTLFSILSTVIIAIILVPFGALQLLAQIISLIVSLSGLIGTFKRSILLSSIYALSMLLFLFLQCSYFFVLLKLVQEVNLTVNSSMGEKSFPYNFPYNSAVLSESHGFEHYPSPYTLPADGLSSGSSQTYASLPKTFRSEQPAEPYSAVKQSWYAADPQHLTYYHRAMPGRHISEMLNEELAYLSLLTVPMLAWLPPSLFMESVAVLLLSMQAIAGACFLYALRRSESYYQHFAYRHAKLDIEHQAMLSDAT